MQEKNAFWLLLLVLIIAVFLRTHQLESIPFGLYPDEAMNGNNALEALRTGDFKIYYPDNNGREGFFINLQAMFLRYFGVYEPWVLRLPSALLGTLTVWGVYLLSRELFSKRVGLLASFFAATSVWHLIFSRMGFRAIMAPLLLTWGLYLFHLALTRISSKRSFWIPAAIGGLVFGLGFHTYIAYRIMPLIFLAFLPFYFRDKGFWRVMGVFVAAAFLAALPIGMYYLENPADFFGRTAQISIFSSDAPLKNLAINTAKTLGMFNIIGDWNWRHNFAGRPELFWPVGILFAWGIILAARTIFGRKSPRLLTIDHEAENLQNWEVARNLRLSCLLLFTWLVLAFLPVVISSEGLPHALRSILMIPPIFIFAGLGAISVYSLLQKNMKRSHALPIGAVLFLVLLAYESYQTYFILWGRNPNTARAFTAEYVEIGRMINRMSDAVPKYVIVEAGGVDVRGLPMPTQTTMFITNTWGPEERIRRNIHYISPVEAKMLPEGSFRFYLR